MNQKIMKTCCTPPHDIFVSGWYFRVHNLTEKFQEYFSKKYTLKEKYFKNNVLLKVILKLKNEDRIIIGVHIRRGDYKYWNDGRFYFSNDVYLKYIKNFEHEIKNTFNKKCTFFIFSNENIEINEFTNIIISKENWYMDHYLMGQCNFLIGPPSTFTLWASYIGKVKYFHIEDDSGEISMNKFKYCSG